MKFLQLLSQENIINGKQPKQNSEYIFLLDHIYDENANRIAIEPCTIVKDVFPFMYDGKQYGYTFTFPLSSNEVAHFLCDDAWAFLENTPENIAKLSQLKELNNKFEESLKSCMDFFNSMNTLSDVEVSLNVLKPDYENIEAYREYLIKHIDNEE